MVNETARRRRMVRGAYERNLAAVAATLELARRDDIRVLVYVTPIRNDVEIPYVESEYAGFKRELEALARERGALFANLEDLVPGQLFGMRRWKIGCSRYSTLPSSRSPRSAASSRARVC